MKIEKTGGGKFRSQAGDLLTFYASLIINGTRNYINVALLRD